MKTLRTVSFAAVSACLLAACVPPTVNLGVSNTVVGATPTASVVIDAGESAVLHWTTQTQMPFNPGATQTIDRNYVINSSDSHVASTSIAENCTATPLSTDWACVKTLRTGTTTVTPYVSGTYTLVATERLYGSLAGIPVPIGDPLVKQSTVSVTVNPDVSISSILPRVTDANLRTCISDNATAQGATTTGQLVNLICSGKSIVRLTGLQYFYAVSILDLSSNSLSSSDSNGASAPTYLAQAASVDLQNSGLTCSKQNAIKTALPMATVLVGQGASTCP